ncbi:MAG: YciI family protein [Chthoniobacterales bacterium]
MFVILLTYKKPIEEIEKHLTEHRAWLDQGYKNDFFLLSGPMNPRTGGVIISQLENREQLEALLKQDPFSVQGLVDHNVIEFEATKHHPQILIKKMMSSKFSLFFLDGTQKCDTVTP